MAKVSLRIYNREIEQLIEQGHTDEAIAHCRHILRTFPKHLETYRVLGKAYLEARRYSDVVDIFSRLLMAVPDDFVAHVGLSIIRDEENKLDDAIWHMERAFEAQPSNAAIQGELQRLYGRRDGMEPPKVRMTRGALARVYVQGELYPQAISEIRAVLAEDPQRTDMQVMLALSYFKSGQKSDASDLCNQLLKRYPYCYDANRIMVDLLPATTGTAKSTQVYRMRIGELDPYANFARGSIFHAVDVPDASISLERLEYVPEQTEDQGWDSSMGIGLGSGVALAASAAGEQPDWLKSGGFDSEAAPQNSLTSASPDLGIASSEAQEDIPDFLRAAGWGTASGPEQPTSIFDDEPAAESDLVPADLPRDLEEKEKQAEAGDIPAWMQPSAEEEKLERGEIPEWLNETSQPVEQEPAQTPDLPIWLEGAEQEFISDDTSLSEKVMGSQDLSDWLSGLDDEPGLNLDPEVLRAPQRPSAASQPEKTADESELPSWLNDTEEETSDEDEWKPASLPTSEPVSALQEQSVTLTADLPDWLQGVDEDVTKQTELAEDTPLWQHREQWEAEESAPQQPKPTSPSDWYPVVAKAEKEKADQQGRGQALMQDPPSPEPVEKKKKEVPVRKQAPQKKTEAGQSGVGLLNQAKSELERGDIPEALMHYGKLIKKGKHLEETITHLSDSLYRYPVEVGIWQALGDAYMRANRLKEALDAYNKAEELIR